MATPAFIAGSGDGTSPCRAPGGLNARFRFRTIPLSSTGGKGMRARVSIMFLAGAAVVAGGCSYCDREGCEAVGRHASPQDVSQGVAGTAGLRSDTSSSTFGQPDCNECPLFRATIRFWRLDALPATPADALAACQAKPPALRIQADPRYEIALDPGDWLACVAGGEEACAYVTVWPGEVTTLNVLVGMGYSQLFAGRRSEALAEGFLLAGECASDETGVEFPPLDP